MQKYISSNLLENLSMLSLPIAFLMLENEEEIAFMAELYADKQRLILRTAYSFYPHDRTAAHEVESDVLIALCKYCKSLMDRESEFLPGYIVEVTKNICKTRLKKEQKVRETRDYYADEYIENYADSRDAYASVFDEPRPGVSIKGFSDLSEHDQMLISMKHVEGLEYSKMAKILNMKVGAVRTAVSRAKEHLRQLINK